MSGEGRCFYVLESREVENGVVAGRVCLHSSGIPCPDGGKSQQ